jgi:hypothetical protein
MQGDTGEMLSLREHLAKHLTPEQLQGAEYVMRMVNGGGRINRPYVQEWYEAVVYAMSPDAKISWPTKGSGKRAGS